MKERRSVFDVCVCVRFVTLTCKAFLKIAKLGKKID